ncbi:hypothetical protein KAI19_01290 [bacterium]|nr:hypothetical protein [bacterium]
MDINKKIDGISSDISRMSLFNRTILRLLIENGVFTEDEFKDVLIDIDGEDGSLDGKITKKKRASSSCPKCKKTIPLNRDTCMYCGYVVHTDEDVF